MEVKMTLDMKMLEKTLTDARRFQTQNEIVSIRAQVCLPGVSGSTTSTVTLRSTNSHWQYSNGGPVFLHERQHHDHTNTTTSLSGGTSRPSILQGPPIMAPRVLRGCQLAHRDVSKV